MSKEEQQPTKGCLDDSMRTESGTEPGTQLRNTIILKSTMFISREYSTDMANIGLWLSSREHSKNFGNGTRYVQQ